MAKKTYLTKTNLGITFIFLGVVIVITSAIIAYAASIYDDENPLRNLRTKQITSTSISLDWDGYNSAYSYNLKWCDVPFDAWKRCSGSGEIMTGRTPQNTVLENYYLDFNTILR